MFRSGKKFSREVSIYDPIGADKDGETVSLFDVLESGDREVLETVIIGQDVKILYEAYRDRLTETEKKVIRMRYGLFGEDEHTQREIAGQLGISRSYVSRIEKKAVARMREAFGYGSWKNKRQDRENSMMVWKRIIVLFLFGKKFPDCGT